MAAAVVATVVRRQCQNPGTEARSLARLVYCKCRMRRLPMLGQGQLAPRASAGDWVGRASWEIVRESNNLIGFRDSDDFLDCAGCPADNLS